MFQVCVEAVKMEDVEGALRELSIEKEEGLIRDWNSANIVHSKMKSVE